jgi:hypothetical protein
VCTERCTAAAQSRAVCPDVSFAPANRYGNRKNIGINTINGIIIVGYLQRQMPYFFINFSNITCYEKSPFTILLQHLTLAATKNGRRMFCHFPIMLRCALAQALQSPTN